jgi:glutamate synthase (NADPH/NADH) small chain
MSINKGFLNIDRVNNPRRPASVRIHDYEEVEQPLPDNERQLQASRCMECGVPFCHWACPVANIMPEWQSKVFEGDWKAAYEILSSTNNFPEITGRVCPALCEASCVLGIHRQSVTMRQNELAVIERAFKEGMVKPRPPQQRSGRKVAVVGSGPAGLACADTLNKAGHTVTLFEAADKVGGYLRYGIPDFKLDKRVLDRRINLMLEEGLMIKTGVKVGSDVTMDELMRDFDAVCITIGARMPRDLPIEGRELDNIHFATDYLSQQNRVISGESIPDEERISAQDKRVVVIGGGDTGADCVGTAKRQGATSVTQLEILPQPPASRPATEPWPLWPNLHKVSSSHEEGCDRLFSVSTRGFTGNDGKVEQLSAVNVSWEKDGDGHYTMEELPSTQFKLEADLVLLALGFVHVRQDGLVDQLGIELDEKGNIAIDENYMTSVNGVFAAGDASRGASLVVWAIQDGRQAAQGMDVYLRLNA